MNGLKKSGSCAVSDRLTISEKLVVLVVAAVSAADLGVVSYELDAGDPFHLLEAELERTDDAESLGAGLDLQLRPGWKLSGLWRRTTVENPAFDVDRTIDELQTDLDAWIVEYNEHRPHQGRWCFSKTPMQTF